MWRDSIAFNSGIPIHILFKWTLCIDWYSAKENTNNKALIWTIFHVQADLIQGHQECQLLSTCCSVTWSFTIINQSIPWYIIWHQNIWDFQTNCLDSEPEIACEMFCFSTFTRRMLLWSWASQLLVMIDRELTSELDSSSSRQDLLLYSSTMLIKILSGSGEQNEALTIIWKNILYLIRHISIFSGLSDFLTVHHK